ncbi:MAG: LamG-like jellyroll fold domain-containing protein [Bryobacteraceae bacterium]
MYRWFGLTDTIQVPASDSLNLPTAGLTMEAWVNPNSMTSGNDVILRSCGWGASCWVLEPNSDGVYVILSTTDGVVGLTQTPAIPGGTWTHLASTYDGAAVRVFVNGVQTDSGPLTGSIPGNSYPLYIGGGDMSFGYGCDYFDGAVDEVRVYSRALSQAEIQNDMLPPVNVAVSLSPASATLTTSQTQQFTATVTGSSNVAVNWSVALGPGAPAGALPGTIGASGLYTAPSTIASRHTVIVTAQSQADTTKSASATVTLNPPETISTPAAPTGPASGTTGTSYTYTASGATSSYGHSVQYQFNWGDGTNSGWQAVGATSASHAWTTASTYQVTAQARCAIDTTVTSAVSTGLAVTMGPPSPPTGLAATPGNTQVTLSWSASTGATSYNVYRSTTSGGEGPTAYATGITSPTYTNTGLTNGTKYYYTVAAVNAGGTSAQSTEVSATTMPAPPTGLTATAGNAQVVLSWTASSGATSYNVYRATTSGGEGTTALVTGIAATTYTNTGLTSGTKYYYTVAAVNAGGTSAQSSEVSATPQAAPTLTSIAPNTGVRGSAVPVTLTGANLTGTYAVIMSSSGVTVSQITVVNPTTVTAIFTVSTSAALTGRAISVVTGGGASNPLTFTVLGPTLTTIAPTSGLHATTVPVTLTGANLTGATTVTVSGSGITVNSIAVVNPTTVTANFVIASTASLTARTVSVTTPIGTTGTVSFTVN